MPVYTKGEPTAQSRFHRSKECGLLYVKTTNPVREVDLRDLKGVRPCRRCYPDSPRARSVHLRCNICNLAGQVRACPHNGGVPVLREITYKKASIMADAGTTYVRTQYVWPEDFWRATAS